MNSGHSPTTAEEFSILGDLSMHRMQRKQPWVRCCKREHGRKECGVDIILSEGIESGKEVLEE